MSESIVESRINKLFAEAEEAGKQSLQRADRYVALAWELKLKENASFTPSQRRRFCKACKQYVPVSMQRVRCNDGVLTRTCGRCGVHQRTGYK